MCVHACRSSFFTLLRTDERTTRGAPIPSRSLFFSFFFLFAMLMRDELAYIFRRRCRRRPSVRRSVSPRHEAGSFPSSLTSVHVGGAQVAYPTGGGPWTYSLPNEHIYKKKEKRKYGSLCLDAHKFRTPLVLRYMVLLHSTHTTNLHYTTCLYLLHTTTTATKMPYVSNPGCLFFLQCRALTRDIRYTLPPSTYHAPLQGGRTTPSSPAVSYIPTLPY